MVSIFDNNKALLKKVKVETDKVLALEETMANLSNEELKHKTTEFQQLLKNGKTLDDILPEAFAVCREMSSRTLGMKHYAVQIMGAVALHKGYIAELKTGEGKTLVETLPAYLNALEGKGVHVITVNEYLAKRDKEQMEVLFNSLGLTVGLSLSTSTPEEKREAYKADITYSTNSEVGFDYLRDCMAKDKKDIIQRKFNYAIIDEVDSVLIDDARTPLIIAYRDKLSEDDISIFQSVDKLVKKMKVQRINELDKEKPVEEQVDIDIEIAVDIKNNKSVLTAAGMNTIERHFGIDVVSPICQELIHKINQSIYANYNMSEGKDYIILDGVVQLVDIGTGRVLNGRRFRDGLHQAIEAKENVEILGDSKTNASITYPGLFSMYNKVSGMTGTAYSSRTEFIQTYGLDVVKIPTNKPVKRVDLPDEVYLTYEEKINAIINEIKQLYNKGQPVLVGTTSITKSEELSDKLKEENIPHQVLNAKHHEREAEIISKAGRCGSVTIATNMAGRGTDIKLSDMATLAGGLYVIGTERHESKRIDDQLRGRSGRQGDPGTSKFIISIEDELLVTDLALKELVDKTIKNSDHHEGQPIDSKKVHKAIDKQQMIVESVQVKNREYNLKIAAVLEKQRLILNNERLEVLHSNNLIENAKGILLKDINYIVDSICKESDVQGSLRRLTCVTTGLYSMNISEDDIVNKDKLKDKMYKQATARLNTAIEKYGLSPVNNLLREIIVSMVDIAWINHLEEMEALKDSVGLRGIANKDPLVEYVMDGSVIMENTLNKIIHSSTITILRAMNQ